MCALLAGDTGGALRSPIYSIYSRGRELLHPFLSGLCVRVAGVHRDDIPSRCREHPSKIGPLGPLLRLLERSQLVAGPARRLVAQQEEVRSNEVVGSQGNGTLYHVGQLPDVAWPVVEHEVLHRLRGKALDGLVHLLAEALQGVVCQEGDVLTALAQWGEEDRDDMNAVVTNGVRILQTNGARWLRCSGHGHPPSW